MNLVDVVVVLRILIIAFPKWIMAVECGRRRYHNRYSDNPFTAAIRKPDEPVQCFAMLFLPHGRVSESDLLITSKDCIVTRVFQDGYVAAFYRGHNEFPIQSPIYLEGHDLRLFQLQNAVTFTLHIQPICIPYDPSTPIPENGTILRWTYGINRMYEINAVNVPDQECSSSTEYKPLQMFCVKANYIHDYVPQGTPYFKEVDGVNTLWGLYAFQIRYNRERRYAFHRMAAMPEYFGVQMPEEQEQNAQPRHYAQYAPLKK